MHRSKGLAAALFQTAGLLGIASVLWPIPDIAKAAEEVVALDAASTSTSLEAITVYARRRGESAADVPLAISVVGGAQVLESAQIVNTNDVIQYVPNAHAAQPGGPSRARWFIRGIGTNNTGNNTVNPIGIYYDDVYIANINNQGYPLFDIDRVEVLNGPQGTLWGKNSNGGAINFVSKAPTFDVGGYAEVSYGSDDEKGLQGAINGPLIGDKLAGRAAFYYRDIDGWQDNLSTGEKAGDGRETAARAQLLYQPNEDLSVLLNVHGRDSSNNAAGPSYAASVTAPLTAGTATQRAFLSVYPNGLPLSGWGETYAVDDGPEDLDGFGGAIKVNWSLGWATLTSITAYEENSLNSQGGGSPIPANSAFYGAGKPFTLTYTDSEADQVSQEFRLTSPDGGKLNWLVGLFGFSGSQDTRSVAAFYIRGAATGNANAWGVGPQYTDTRYKQQTDNYAVFGSVGYAITDRFKISAGARWSHEETTFDWYYGAANAAGTAATFIANLPTTQFWLYRPRDLVYVDTDSQETTAWTYDVTPEYELTDTVKLYARYAHGVLPGGFTNTGYVNIPGTTTRANQIYRLDPEEIDAYEAGVKGSWFDGRLQADVAAFFYEYTNLVVNVPTVLDPANPTIATVLFRNAGAAEIKGLELRASAAPTERLQLSGSFGYLDSEYTEDTGTTATILGAQAPRSPHYTANLSINYKQPIGGGRSIDVGLDARYSSKFFFYPTVSSQITNPDPVLSQSAFTVVNGRIRFNFDEEGRFAFQLSGLNLTDKKYKNHSLPISNGASNQTYGRPRSVLATLTAKF